MHDATPTSPEPSPPPTDGATHATGQTRAVKTFGPTQWSELRSFIDTEFGQGFANSDFVFRGECRCHETVLPKIDRLLPPGTPGEESGRLNGELQAMLRFRQNAAMHLDSLQRQMLNEGMQAQVVMRHYGAPTRLLDWTLSPWVALFFACEDAGQPPSPAPPVGRVLAFDRSVVERAVAEQFAAESGAHGEAIANVQGWTVPRLLTLDFARSARDWVVCYHRHAEQFPRLVAQQGLFTIGSKPWLDHWEHVRRLCPDNHHELRIDPGLKAEIMRRLVRMGITAATLFPDLDGVSREIEAHTRIYTI